MGRAGGRVTLSGATHVHEPLTVVIVGGVAAGTLAAIRLAEHPAQTPRRIVVIEPAGELGRGAAYGTRSPSHLLNVRASGMSAYPEDGGHFLAWSQRQGIDAQETDFLPRMLYGGYLRDTLAGRAEHVRGRVTGMSALPAGRWTVAIDDGQAIEADHVILATGNALALLTGALDHPRVVADPWSGEGIANIGSNDEVLIVGSGLTAVDVILSLRDASHEGRVRMLSSHGLLPEAHVPQVLPAVPPFVSVGDRAGRSVRGAMAAARAANADDWRQVVDGVRPQIVGLWRDLPLAEQQRFVRHLARRWDVRRHRMAPQVAAVVEQLRARGRLVVEHARVTGVTADGDRVHVSHVAAGMAQVVTVDAVVVCVGPSADPRRDPFLATLLESRVASRHPLGLGLDVEPDGQLRMPDGAPQPGLWAMGSLRKGAEWESTAVPELRLHARNVADQILGDA